ncbi:MAG: pyrroline-5-carboxylate reductase [Pseudomonadota bacterium]
MSTVLGCIGCGNMGAAILQGLASYPDLQLLGCDHSPCKLEALKAANVQAMPDVVSLVEASDFILVAVKPAYVEDVLKSIEPHLTPNKVVISIVSGLSIATMKATTANKAPVIRVMPNTPAMVGAGVFALCFADSALSQAKADYVHQLFAALGSVLVLPESQFNAFTAVAGCGPAYVFHFMEAMVESAVTLGFTRKAATTMVTDLFAGSVKLAQHSDLHLSELREAVCSPAGNTIAAMNQLDRTAVRGHIIDAVLAAHARGKEMER